jgi:periplasmic protein TonB
MAAYANDTNFISRRALVLIIIIAFHVLFAYLLASGLARRAIETIAPPLQTDIIEETQQREEPPPPPPPEMERPPVEVPPPEVSIDIPVETQSTAIQDVTNKPVQNKPPPPPPPPPVARNPPKFDTRRSPSTDEYYPPTSRRMGEQGTTTVAVCITPEGRVTGEPKVEKSSGSARLDEAAAKYATKTRWAPATENGKPVQFCSNFNVKFVLTD